MGCMPVLLFFARLHPYTSTRDAISTTSFDQLVSSSIYTATGRLYFYHFSLLCCRSLLLLVAFYCFCKMRLRTPSSKAMMLRLCTATASLLLLFFALLAALPCNCRYSTTTVLQHTATPAYAYYRLHTSPTLLLFCS
jgi:hypothetical protein